MYTITLEINQKCNLKCRYCYLGDKSGAQMTRETAYKSIDLGVSKAKKHRDQKLGIDFVGGEPTIDYEFIKDIVEYCNEECRKKGIEKEFMITTNAFFLNKEMIDFFIDNKFSLKISLDGTKEVNDRNRLVIGGGSSYDKVVDKLPLLKYYENKTKKYIQVTNVITKENYKEYYNSLVHLTRDLGLKFIDTSIDLYVPWTYDEYKVLEACIYKSFDYFVESYNNNNGFIWSFINSAEYLLTKRSRVYSCGAGVISLYIRSNGGCYPCPGCFKENARIGSIIEGLNDKKIDEFKYINQINNPRCQNCDIYSYCNVKSCLMMNLQINNDIHKPVEMCCWLTKLKYNLIREKNHVFSKSFEGVKDDKI